MDSGRGSIKQFVCLCLLGLILYPTLILALTLSWSPNPQPNVNYKLYYGDSPNTYTNAVSTGTNLTYNVAIQSNVSYYFAVVAQDNQTGTESDFSSELGYIPTTNTVYHLILRSAPNLTDWVPFLTIDVTNNQPQQFYNLTITK